MIFYSSLNCYAFAYSLFTVSSDLSDDTMIIGPYVAIGVILTMIFVGFFNEMLNPEVSGMEIRIVYDKNEKKVPQSEIYDRTTKIKNFKRICKGMNPIGWILPI